MTVQLLYSLFYTLLPILAGIGILAIYHKEKKKRNELEKSGEKAEGIIFEFSNAGTGANDSAYQLPVIRFLTQKGEWITEEYFVSSVFHTKGQKVQVLYDPQNPKKFIIEKNVRAKFIINYILPLLGIAAIAFGLFRTYQYKIGEILNN